MEAAVLELWERESLMPAYRELITSCPPEARRALALAAELKLQDQDLQTSRPIARKLLQEEVDLRSQQVISPSHRYLPTAWEKLVHHQLERLTAERSTENLRKMLTVPR